MKVLQIDGVTKSFKSVTPIKDLTLEIEQGKIFGFLGQNGSGKTTTLRMITGLAKPTEGSITICGERVVFGGGKTTRNIGYLPDVPEYYNFMTPKEYLALCGNLYGLKTPVIKERTTELLKLVGLEGVSSKRKIHGFSRGMKQRLGIAQALIHRPQLLLLDEPTSALDPVGRKDILDIMASLKGELTILFSTHILSDVERVCDRIGVLHGGKIALESDVDDLRVRHNSQVVLLKIVDEHKIDAVIKRLQQQPFVIRTKKGEKGFLHITSSQIDVLYAQICPILSDLQVSLEHFEVMEPNLEDVFMEVIKG